MEAITRLADSHAIISTTHRAAEGLKACAAMVSDTSSGTAGDRGRNRAGFGLGDYFSVLDEGSDEDAATCV